MNFRNAVLSRLTDTDLSNLGEQMNEVSLGSGEVICEENQRFTHLYFPGSAVLSVVTVMKNGQAAETATVGFESAPGLLPVLTNQVSTTRVFAQVPGSAIRIPAAFIRKYAFQERAVLELLLLFALANSRQAELSVACNALHTVSQRMARWLLLTRDRVGHQSIPLTQDFLAVMLGTQRTTISSAANTMKRSGLISYRRGNIQILDNDGLERAACECYAEGRSITFDLGQNPPSI